MRLSKNQWRKRRAIGFFQRRINGARRTLSKEK
jgi:hypothetical protein